MSAEEPPAAPPPTPAAPPPPPASTAAGAIARASAGPIALPAPAASRLDRLVAKPAAFYSRHEQRIGWCFFAGGFAWDSVTLGRSYGPLDLWILFAYWLGAAALLALLGRKVAFRGAKYLDWGLQFCFGSLFSAFTVLYFISASSWPSLCFVCAVAGLLVVNEFLKETYSDLTLSWAFFSFCGAMFFNFALPHVFRSVSPWWFYLSTALGLAAAYGVRRLATGERASFVPSWVIGSALVLAFLFNWIPPVPMVKTDLVIGRDFSRSAAQYTMRIEKPPFWRYWSRTDRVVHQRGDEKVWCYSAIFLPRGIEAQIVHRWEYDDPNEGWVLRGRVPIAIRGGRTDGFRGWSYKQSLAPGDWRVSIETPNGQVAGVRYFRVEPAAPGAEIDFKEVHLR